jgi:hypothetical protein
MTKIYILERNNIPFYIGKTLQKVKNRHYTHGDKKINSEIIEIDCVDDDEWRFWESWYIELFKSWGFELENKNNGGGGRGPGWISSPERNTKIKASLQNHSQYYTDEVKQKISNALKNKLNPFTEEHIKNLTESHQKRAKTVYQFDLQGNLIKEWVSKGEAAKHLKEELNLTSNVVSQIKDCILGYQKTAFRYIWSYENIKPKNTFDIIYQFDLNKNLINSFTSLKELKEWLKENRTEVYDINPIASSIKKESKKRTYKSGNNFYSLKNKI